MSCSCRTAALRIFVRSVVHTPLLPPPGTRALSQSLRPSGFTSKAPISTTTFQRNFTTTRLRRSDKNGDDVSHGATRTGASDDAQESNQLQQKSTIRRADDAERSSDGSVGTGSKPSRRAANRPEESDDPSLWTAINEQPKKSRRSRETPTQEPEAPPARQKLVVKLKQHEPAQHPAPPEPRKTKEQWAAQKAALKEKFPDGWQPRKRLSPDALAGIRALHQQFPEEYTTEVLADKFEVSPEAIRRILKSKWEPNPDEEIERQQRWFNRGKQIWGRWAELGKKPPVQWRKEGITRSPEFHERRKARAKARARLSRTLI